MEAETDHGAVYKVPAEEIDLVDKVSVAISRRNLIQFGREGIGVDVDGKRFLENPAAFIRGTHPNAIAGLEVVIQNCVCAEMVPFNIEKGVIDISVSGDQGIGVRVADVGINGDQRSDGGC